MAGLRTCALALVLLIATGCAPTRTTVASGGPATPDPTPSPAVIETVKVEGKEVAGRRVASTDDAVIVYERSGGFAGTSESWSVYADGRVVKSDGKQGRMSPEEVADLLKQIEAAGFFGMRGSYVPLNSCCDRFTYKLTVRKDGQARTVTTIDEAPQQPPELATILGQVAGKAAKAVAP